MHTIPRRQWQIAGALVITHVVLILVGILSQDTPLFSEGRAGVQEEYVAGDLARTFSAALVEAFGFLVLVPVIVFLSRALGRRTEAGRWAAQTGLMFGLAYVAVTFAVGFPAGGAAMYGVQHGLDIDTAFALNNVRIFGYFLSLMLLGGATIGVAVSALGDRVGTGWIGRFGLVTGGALLVSTPLAGIGHQDWGTLLWMVWFVGVGVLMLRHRPPTGVEQSLAEVPDSASIRHS